jgi:hypothetical protein
VGQGTRRLRRAPGERLLAWLFVGPLGHLWSTAADITVAWVRYAAARLRGP